MARVFVEKALEVSEALHEIEEGKYTQDHFHGVEQTQYELDQQSQEDDDEYQSEESERSPE